MSYSHQQLDEMMVAAWQLPLGPSATAAAEEIIRHADANMWADLQYAGRILATRTYQYGSEPSKAFVTFSWCLNAYDRGEADPRFDHQLFWYFKWMVSSLANFPEVPLDRTHAVLDDMERRYRLGGHGMNPVHQRREMLARHIGDLDTAREEYRLWNASPRGGMSDCERCEPSWKAGHLIRLGLYEDAVAIAQPALVSDGDCTEQPHGILAKLLPAYLHTGRLEEAVDAHRRSYRAVQNDRGELHAVGSHLRFCAMTGNHSRGLELLERHIGWLEEPPNPMAAMHFSAAAANLLLHLDKAGYDDVTVQRPGGEIEVRDLQVELAARAREIAARFDARNGTGEQSESIRKILEAEPIVEYLPLSGVARRAELLEATEPAPLADALPESLVDPAELADLAELEFLRDNDDLSAEAWQRFDELCPEPESLLLARRVTGLGSHVANEEPEEAEQHWVYAMELFTATGDEVRALAVQSRVGMIRCLLGRQEEGLPQVAESVDRLAELDAPEQHVRALSRLASAYQAIERLDDAREVLARAEKLAERTGNDELVADIVLATVPLIVQQGPEHVPGAISTTERAISLYRNVPGTNRLRQAQFMAANLHAGSGQFDTADALLSEAAHSTSPALRAAALHTRGRVALDQNNFGQAVEHLTDAVAVFTNAGEPVQAAYVRVDLAAAALNAEQFADAADAAEEALPVLERAADVEEIFRARFLLAKAYEVLGQQVQAVELLDQVAKHCVAGGNLVGAAQMFGEGAAILDKLDRDAEAADHYSAAADACAATGEMVLEEVANRREAALSWHWAHEMDRCMAALSTADSLAAKLPQDEPHAIWQRSLVNYDGARIFANVGEFATALDRNLLAIKGFGELGAAAELSVAQVLRGRLLANLDRREEADAVLTAALEELPAEATAQREQIETLISEIRS